MNVILEDIKAWNEHNEFNLKAKKKKSAKDDPLLGFSILANSKNAVIEDIKKWSKSK